MKKYIATLLIAIPGFIWANQPDTLSLETCVQLAIQNNKNLQGARLGIKSSAYTLRSAKANFFPNIYASAREIYSTIDGSFKFPGMGLEYKVGPVFNGGVTLEQPVYMGGKISAGYRMAKIGTQVADLNERLSEVDIIMETNRAYAMVVKANQMLTVAQSYKEVLDGLESNVRSAIKHGMRPANDLLKVQVRGNEAELMIRRAENALTLARMNLAHVIGVDMFSEIKVQSEIDTSAIGGHVEYNPDDISTRPEYALLERQIDYSKEKIKFLRSEMLPQIGVQLGYGYTYGVELNGRNLLHRNTFNAILNVSIPLTHFGERSNKLNAEKVNLERLCLERSYKDEQMQLELAQTINKLDEAFLELDLAERSLVQAAENMRLSESQYRNGMETLTDYLEAQLLWQQAFRTLVENRYNLYISHLNYLRATGKLNSIL